MSPFRHRLRSLMVIVAASAALFALIHASGSVENFAVAVSHSPLWWAVVPLGPSALAWSIGPSVRGRAGRLMIGAVLVFGSIATAYLIWADHRLTYQLFELPRDFPHPDPALIALERWFDARYPLLNPDALKIHGEFPRVQFTLRVAILLLSVLDGLALGLLLDRRPDGKIPG